MVRVLVLVLFACVCAATPAFAQQGSQQAPSNDLIDLLKSVHGTLVQDEDHIRLIAADPPTEGVELPIPRHNGLKLVADQIDIDLKTEHVVATGNVTFRTPEGSINAERIEFNIKDGTGTFHNAVGLMTFPNANRAEFGSQRPDVYFWGTLIEKRGPKKYVVTDGNFTTCVQPTPRWELSSDRFTINLDDYVIAKNTVLRVKNVPVLYLPMLYYPLHDEGRSTGFLMPKYGTSTFRGPSLSNAFFLTLGRSQDATFFHDWFTRAGTGAGTEYRYLSGVGSSGLVRFYRFNQKANTLEEDGVPVTLPDQTTYQIDAAVTQNLGHGLRGQANVEYFSDVATQQLYQQNTYQRSMSRRTISGGVTGSYGRATVGGYYSRSEQFSDTSNSTVYGSTPRATLNIAPSKLFGSPIYASLNTEYLFQPNRQLLNGDVIQGGDQSMARFDVAPELRVPLSRLTYLSVTTNAAYRSTYFSKSVDPTGAFVDESVTRQYMSVQTDVIGPVFSKIWDTPESGYSDRMKHVIEPTFSVEAISEIANNERVPRTDSSVFAVGGAVSFTYGITNRLIARTRGVDGARGTTRELLTVGVQQTYYTNPATSLFDTNYASYSSLQKPLDFSPIAVTARLSPTAVIDANARLEYDVAGAGLRILTMGSTLNTPTSSTSLSFSRQRFVAVDPATTPDEISSYLSASTSWRFDQGRSSAFYGLNWDIDAKYIYSQSIGASYMAQCCGVQADFQVVNFLPSTVSPIPSDKRLNFAFVLAGLGTFSNFFGLFGGQP
jgi:lipopolysaccharide assembly outer membrane protein LptD (OstA)